MKTNPLAHALVRIRGCILCLALLGAAGGAYSLGDALARAVRVKAPQTVTSQPHSFTLAELMAGLR